MRVIFVQMVLRRGATWIIAIVFALTYEGIAVSQQSGGVPARGLGITTDVALTSTFERTEIVGKGCGCFWLKGGSVDAAVTFYRGLGVAVNLTGAHAANIAPGVNFGKLTFLAGPRYTFSPSRHTRQTRFFAEALFGGVHGFDALFPANGGAVNTANAFATQLGGGVDIGVASHFSLRALELDYVRTTLPNDAANSQNDLRISFGVTYRQRNRN